MVVTEDVSCRKLLENCGLQYHLAGGSHVALPYPLPELHIVILVGQCACIATLLLLADSCVLHPLAPPPSPHPPREVGVGAHETKSYRRT